MLNKKSYYIFLLAFTLMMIALPIGIASAQTTTSNDDSILFGLIGSCVCGAITLAAWGGATFWVYNDANARGQSDAMLWTIIIGGLGMFSVLGSFLIPIIGLLCCNIPGIGAVIYYIMQRPDKAKNDFYQQYPPGGPMNY